MGEISIANITIFIINDMKTLVAIAISLSNQCEYQLFYTGAHTIHILVMVSCFGKQYSSQCACHDKNLFGRQFSHTAELLGDNICTGGCWQNYISHFNLHAMWLRYAAPAFQNIWNVQAIYAASKCIKVLYSFKCDWMYSISYIQNLQWLCTLLIHVHLKCLFFPL